MSALSAARDTREVYCHAIKYTYVIEAAGTIYQGGIVALNSDGKAVAAADTSGHAVIGIAQNGAVSGGNVTVESGVWLLDNGTSTEALTRRNIGKTCLIVDDHTVGAVGGSNHVRAGKVIDVTTDGVAVAFPGDLDVWAAIDHTHASA